MSVSSYLSSTTGVLIASGSMRLAVNGRLSRGEMMKIYMLMVLIGAIAAMSHLSSERAGSLITAAFRARRRTSD
jgi:hypothetical protein